jgi:cyclic pyranopterin phosphate synthase
VARGLTHFDRAGRARMVDVGAKAETERVAVASGYVRCAAATVKAIAAGKIGKGDVLGIARTAGLMGLKRTSELVPLCHPVRVVGAELELSTDRAGVVIKATVRAQDRTGVEMEALTAVSVAALTVYDMCKAIDRGMVIEAVQLEEKRGGKSGTWKRKS